MQLAKYGLILLLGATTLAVSGHVAAATADMMDTNGNSIGQITLIQTPKGVLLKAELRGLSPGGHGFHVHEKGSCSPDFRAAGGHFNPTGLGHGLNHGSGSHAGDMPNIYAAADGSAVAEVFNTKVSLSDGSSSVFDGDGSAIIIHAKPDTHGEKAGAGARVACGVIRR
jgi:Cu-Zn family superoxide dismutase